MAKIIIQRDEDGLLMAGIESGDQSAGWAISDSLAQALIAELENNITNQFSADLDPVYQDGLSMLKGDEGMKTLRDYNLDRGGGEYE